MLHIGLDIIYLAFCCYLHHQFFNHHRYRADGILIPVLRQAMSVTSHIMTDPVFINKILTHLNDKYPNVVHMKEYFRTLFQQNDDSQHDIRRAVTDTLLTDELVDLGGDKQSKVFLVINKKGRDVVKDGGYEKYLEKRSTQTDRQNEIDDLTYKKLKYDTANSERIYTTYWWTFRISIAAFVISLVLLALKLIELVRQ